MLKEEGEAMDWIQLVQGRRLMMGFCELDNELVP
jgi:hypothetical protein